MSASDYLKKAVEYDMSGRKLESLKLYEQGLTALLETCKGNTHNYFTIYQQKKTCVDCILIIYIEHIFF